MKKQIRALKLNLKEIAQEIRNQKVLRKKLHPHHAKYIGDYILFRLRDEFRHKHVAYCVARGRDIEKIDRGLRLDLDRVNWIVKTMQSNSKEKLYVVVNDQLSISQQAVQSAHAVAEFLRKYPHTMWSNGHLILLKEKPAYGGNMGRYGYYCGVEHAEFKEPDLDNKITAYALFGSDVEKLMKNKPLL
jgi:hypothetical protein